MHIGELAKEAGVSVQTLRYYERYGLLQEPERKPSRYRIYQDTDILKIGEERLAELQSDIEQLTMFRNQLARAVTQWKKSPEQAPAGDAICILIERTMAGSSRPVLDSEERRKAKWHLNKVKSTSVRTRNVGVKSR